MRFYILYFVTQYYNFLNVVFLILMQQYIKNFEIAKFISFYHYEYLTKTVDKIYRTWQWQILITCDAKLTIF